jgi:hypothetical protein
VLPNSENSFGIFSASGALIPELQALAIANINTPV